MLGMYLSTSFFPDTGLIINIAFFVSSTDAVSILGILPLLSGSRISKRVTGTRKRHIYAVGIENSRLSARSNMPPWPGMRLEKSFTPIMRFISDSGQIPYLPHGGGHGAGQHAQPERYPSHRPGMRVYYHARHKRGMKPQTQPSTVLFGLTSGATWCLPKRLPPKRAKLSHTHVERQASKAPPASSG